MCFFNDLGLFRFAVTNLNCSDQWFLHCCKSGEATSEYGEIGSTRRLQSVICQDSRDKVLLKYAHAKRKGSRLALALEKEPFIPQCQRFERKSLYRTQC
jgi:hypothetical protein